MSLKKGKTMTNSIKKSLLILATISSLSALQITASACGEAAVLLEATKSQREKRARTTSEPCTLVNKATIISKKLLDRLKKIANPSEKIIKQITAIESIVNLLEQNSKRLTNSFLNLLIELGNNKYFLKRIMDGQAGFDIS